MFSNLSMTATAKIDYPIADSKLPFAEYIALTRAIIENRRLDLKQPANIANMIIEANSPYILAPNNPIRSGNLYKYGALLIHGLYDCPFSMRDIGEHLQENGVLCHAITLPGHGTQPSDLINISYHDWLQAVRYGIESMKNEVENVFLVGYSTGAALAIYHAIQDKQIAGIALVAPATALSRAAMWGLFWRKARSLFYKDSVWLHQEEEIDYVKYLSISTNSVKQILQLMDIVQQLADEHHMTTPTFMALSQNDETISAHQALEFFSSLPNHDNRALLYTANGYQPLDPRIQIRHVAESNLPIKNYSHICLPFKPSNTHYGSNGDYARASHPDGKDIYGAYNRGEEHVYDFLYQLGLLRKRRRKLTFNPDFPYFANEIVRFIMAS